MAQTEKENKSVGVGYSSYDLRVWTQEVIDHDKTGCPGKDFTEPWYGGLICTKCGK